MSPGFDPEVYEDVKVFRALEDLGRNVLDEKFRESFKIVTGFDWTDNAGYETFIFGEKHLCRALYMQANPEEKQKLMSGSVHCWDITLIRKVIKDLAKRSYALQGNDWQLELRKIDRLAQVRNNLAHSTYDDFKSKKWVQKMHQELTGALADLGCHSEHIEEVQCRALYIVYPEASDDYDPEEPKPYKDLDNPDCIPPECDHQEPHLYENDYLDYSDGDYHYNYHQEEPDPYEEPHYQDHFDEDDCQEEPTPYDDDYRDCFDEYCYPEEPNPYEDDDYLNYSGEYDSEEEGEPGVEPDYRDYDDEYNADMCDAYSYWERDVHIENYSSEYDSEEDSEPGYRDYDDEYNADMYDAYSYWERHVDIEYDEETDCDDDISYAL